MSVGAEPGRITDRSEEPSGGDEVAHGETVQADDALTADAEASSTTRPGAVVHGPDVSGPEVDVPEVDGPDVLDGTDAPSAPIEDLLAAATKERDEYLGALQRLQADFENFRKRMLRQQEEQSARAASDLVGKLLPVLDALDLAQAHLGTLVAGEELSHEAQALAQARALLIDALAKEGLERVADSDVSFDPSVHDAVAHAPVEEDETVEDEDQGVKVDEVLRAGYRWRNQVLRPAMVRVKG